MDFAKKAEIKSLLFSVSGFLFFTLILALPSGYSYGALLCLVAGLCFIKEANINKIGLFFFMYLLLLGVFFSTGEYGFFSWNEDIAILWKYLACAFLGIILIGRKISVKYLIFGMCFGAIFCGVISIYQYVNIGRATGFTNAIRYGNISILISFWLFLFGFFSFLSKRERAFVFLCAILALMSSILSLSRGGWALIFLWIVLLCWLTFKDLVKKVYFFAILFVFAIIFIMAGGVQRIANGWHESGDYFSRSAGASATSVGARLEMYRFAVDVFSEKPVLGWGKEGERKQLEIRVKDGSYSNYLLSLPHLHNEFLDTIARKGIVGGGILLTIYLFPLFLLKKVFWHKTFLFKTINDQEILKSAIILLPFSYFLFGLSDLFFHINISHFFYGFSLLFLLSAYVSLESEKNGI